MKTVLPERDKPVTPRRTVGLIRPDARSARLSRAMRASSEKEVRLGGKAEFRWIVTSHIGTAGRREKTFREKTLVDHKINETPAWQPAVIVENRKAGRRKAGGERLTERPVANQRFERLFHRWVMADKHH